MGEGFLPGGDLPSPYRWVELGAAAAGYFVVALAALFGQSPASVGGLPAVRS